MCSVFRVTWPPKAAPIGARHRPGIGLHATHVEGQHRIVCLHQCQHVLTTLTGGHLGLVSPGSVRPRYAGARPLCHTHTRTSLLTRGRSLWHTFTVTPGQPYMALCHPGTHQDMSPVSAQKTCDRHLKGET